MDLFDIVAARVGGGSGGGVPQVQSDWEQNDSSKKSYIKNRTHWKEEIERDYTILPNVEPDPMTGFIKFGKKIGLEIGKEYTLEAHLVDGTVETIQAIATEMPEEDIGIAGIPCFMLDFGTVADGVVFDLTTQTFTTGDNCYYFYDDDARELLEKVIIKNLPNVETIVHQIPEEYIPKKCFEIEDSSVTTDKLASGSVTTDKLAKEKYVRLLDTILIADTGSIEVSEYAGQPIKQIKEAFIQIRGSSSSSLNLQINQGGNNLISYLRLTESSGSTEKFVLQIHLRTHISSEGINYTTTYLYLQRGSSTIFDSDVLSGNSKINQTAYAPNENWYQGIYISGTLNKDTRIEVWGDIVQ